MLAPEQRSFVTHVPGRRVGRGRERIYLNQLAVRLWAAFRLETCAGARVPQVP